jgi:hypothetical protein
VIVSELETSLLQEEICWKQKSRIRWLKVVDKCTKFLHQIANSNRRFNSVEPLFFFDKSKYYIKKRRGAQPLVHWKYTRGTRERGKKGKENLQS